MIPARILLSALALAALAGALPSPADAAARPAARAGVSKAATPVLPFLQDDYPKAVALARARKVPLFIEAWAPW